ncbi:MAG: DUF2905 domain-containing protein [Deltaproteobacteria bacterium]|nr:DUF2905 domain-containing protein [Deltaproteobacteria bacterium]RLA88046.1 MAG: DUF2905 domain-containing protein [Deltaproteobacteria bacterium]
MEPFGSMGKVLILMGIFLVIVGIFFIFGSKIPFIGKLPGDIVYKKGNFTFYFPIVTSIVVSILLTLILNLIFRK